MDAGGPTDWSSALNHRSAVDSTAVAECRDSTAEVMIFILRGVFVKLFYVFVKLNLSTAVFDRNVLSCIDC